jgi:hypothetical protein
MNEQATSLYDDLIVGQLYLFVCKDELPQSWEIYLEHGEKLNILTGELTDKREIFSPVDKITYPTDLFAGIFLLCPMERENVCH